MIQTRRAISLGSAAIIAVALGACGSDRAVGPIDGQIDPGPVQNQVAEIEQVMQAPALQSLFPSGGNFFAATDLRSPKSPVDVMLARTRALVGPRLSVQPGTLHQSVRAKRAAVAALAASESWIPAEALGKTFVRVGDSYTWDRTRTGAPPNGARIALYERLSDDRLGTTEVGMLEIIDNTRNGQLSGAATIFDKAGAQVGSMSWYETSAGASSSSGMVVMRGTLGTSGKQIVMADTMSGSFSLDDDESDDYSMSVAAHTTAAFANAGLHINMSTASLFGDEASLSYSFRVVSGSNTVRIEASFPPGTDGTFGTVYLNDSPIAKLNEDSDPMFRAPSGGAASAEVIAYLTAIETLIEALPVGVNAVSAVEELLYEVQYSAF